MKKKRNSRQFPACTKYNREKSNSWGHLDELFWWHHIKGRHWWWDTRTWHVRETMDSSRSAWEAEGMASTKFREGVRAVDGTLPFFVSETWSPWMVFYFFFEEEMYRVSLLDSRGQRREAVQIGDTWGCQWCLWAVNAAICCPNCARPPYLASDTAVTLLWYRRTHIVKEEPWIKVVDLNVIL